MVMGCQYSCSHKKFPSLFKQKENTEVKRELTEVLLIGQNPMPTW